MVNTELSYGMFESDQLMGFILNGVDQRDGHHIAFNTGTGVIPEYRGKKMVKMIYEHAIPELKAQGITKCGLEVIKINDIAVKTYQGIGFEVCRELKCFGGSISNQPQRDIEVVEVDSKNWNWDILPQQELYSWDNHQNSLSRGEYRYFKVKNKGADSAFFITNQSKSYIAQCDPLVSTDESWQDLLCALEQETDAVKINNIPKDQDIKIEKIESVGGLLNTVDQYEMELYL
jgi:hypothetical protein